MAGKMSICPKCGNFKMMTTCCNIPSVKTELPFMEYLDMSDNERDKYVNHCIETLIKDTYDPEAAEYRKNNQKPVNFGKSGIVNKPKCPTCKSTNLKKISVSTRAVKTSLFGIFGAMDDAGKTYKCNNCGSKF